MRWAELCYRLKATATDFYGVEIQDGYDNRYTVNVGWPPSLCSIIAWQHANMRLAIPSFRVQVSILSGSPFRHSFELWLSLL